MTIGIVVPCFNESLRIKSDYWSALIGSDIDVAWLFIDDGSTDETLSIISSFSQHANVSIKSLPKNQGKSEAIRCGALEMLHHKSEIRSVGFLDADGAFSCNEVVRIIEIARDLLLVSDTKIECVISSRVKLAGRDISRNMLRHYISRVLLTIVNWKWDQSPYDTQSGFKIFLKTPSFEQALQRPFVTKWFLDLELFARIGAMTGENKIWEEPVRSWVEVPGSKLGFKSVLTVCKEILYILKIARSARRERQWT